VNRDGTPYALPVQASVLVCRTERGVVVVGKHNVGPVRDPIQQCGIVENRPQKVERSVDVSLNPINGGLVELVAAGP